VSDVTWRVQGGWIDCCTIYSAVGLCGVHECRQKGDHVNGSCETTCLDIVGLAGVVGGRGRHARNVLSPGICWVSSGYAAMQVKERFVHVVGANPPRMQRCW
jgi:hypothetical protein